MKNLRERAEKLLEKINDKEKQVPLKNIEDLDLIHEILVYQKELELQNEELQSSYIELENTRNRYFELYNNAPFGYVTLTRNGIITEYNRTFLNIIDNQTIKSGYSAFSQFIHKDDLERYLSIYRRYFEHPEGNDIEFKLNTEPVKFVRISGKSATLPDGEPVLRLSVMDITESYLAQRKIETYLDIIENAQVSIVITDKNNNIEYVNKHFTRLTGYSKDEVLGKNPNILASGQTSPNIYKEMWNNLNNGRSWNGVFINKTKNGKIYYEDVYITPIFGSNGEILNYFAVKLDVTDKLTLRQKEEENEKLKSLVKLTGGIAHNLNNFMTPIVIIGEYFRNNIKDENMKKQTKILLESAEKVTSVIKKMLKYSQNYWISPVTFNFSEFLKRNYSYFEHIVGVSANFRVREKDKNVNIHADESLLLEAITNLLENSKAAVEKKIITNPDKLGDIIMDVFLEDRDTLKITVSDNGVGMNKETLERACEPFFSTNNMAMSQGLGLSTAKGIIEQHGGRLKISSEEGVGTVVEICLPVNKMGEKNGNE